MRTTDNQDARWSTWLRDVELYSNACNIDFKPQKKAVLLHLVGEQAREIYYAKAQANDDFDEVKRILSEHFTPQINIEFETFKFGELKQKDNETLDDFVVRLRTQARLCNLDNAASITLEIRKQVIRGGRCSKLRQKILEAETPLRLEEILTKARTGEMTREKLKTMDKMANKQEIIYKNELISAVETVGYNNRHNKNQSNTWRKKNSVNKYAGSSSKHSDRSCHVPRMW